MIASCFEDGVNFWDKKKANRRFIVSDNNFQFFDMIRSAEEVIENEEVGHLMRTKYLGVNEGGVNTGYSCLDTPFLIEWDCQPITYMYMCIR